MAREKREKNQLSREDRIKIWKTQQAAVGRKLKNRSSKNILKINHVSTRSIYRTMSRQALEEMSKNGSWDADMELTRRNTRAARRAANKATKV